MTPSDLLPIKRAWTIVLVLVLVGIVTFTLVAWHRHYLQAEERIASYCSNQRAGNALTYARLMAEKSVLSATWPNGNSAKTRPITVTYVSPVLPIVSACTLRHDGQRLIMVSYDPWYH